MKTTDQTTITLEADAVKPLRPSLPDGALAHHYQWLPECDGFTLYRMRNGQMGRNCGRLNTDATGSTNRLAQLYNAAPDLLARCERLEGALRAMCDRVDKQHKDGRADWTEGDAECFNQARAALATVEKGGAK